MRLRFMRVIPIFSHNFFHDAKAMPTGRAESQFTDQAWTVNLHTLMAATLLGTALLMSSASMAQDNDPLSQYADDPATTSKVKAALLGDQMLSALDIKVQSDDLGAVHLSGTARSPAEVSHATALARGVSGVVSVQNDIVVESKASTTERKSGARLE